jgi:hypothetical protein
MRIFIKNNHRMTKTEWYPWGIGLTQNEFSSWVMKSQADGHDNEAK